MTGEARRNPHTRRMCSARGRDVLDGNPDALAIGPGSISPIDPAILYLTSGATGEPKMGLTSHAAILSNAERQPDRVAHKS